MSFSTSAAPRAAQVSESMRGNFNNLMKQAQAMQANMQKAQAEIASIEVIGEAGGGMVKITMNGRHEVTRVQEKMASLTAGLQLPPGMKLPF